MRNLLLALKKKITFMLIFLLYVISIFGQNWSLGGYNDFHQRFNSSPLQVKSYGRASLLSKLFVSSVGGVAFDGVAIPAAGTNFSSLKLEYKPELPDGQRMKFVIDNKSYTISLPDWELIPIANFADSYFTSCVTLFGKETNYATYHIQYHSCFENCLLGLRLLQADIMLENIVDFSEVFKYNGKYLLGKGEFMPDNKLVDNAIVRVGSILERFGNNSFDSYVLTDAAVKIEFKVSNNQFLLTGTPYYFFFKYGYGDDITEAKSLTQALKDQYAQIRNLNPLVYDAVTRTMRYAAFFRYVKRNYPTEWQTFLSSISALKTIPKVQTPTSMEKP